MRLTLLHFTFGGVGGVEQVMAHHAKLFAAHGHDVSVVSGSRGQKLRGCKVRFLPALASDHPLALAAQREIAAGKVGRDFAKLEHSLVQSLRRLFSESDVVFAHNILTMPFHLACSSALWHVANECPQTRFVAWIHDIAACNPDYKIPQREPWSLLASAHPRAKFVAVSDLRKKEFVALTKVDPKKVRVIPNGISPAKALALTPRVAEFVERFRILKNDFVLLHPARLVRRKNVELSLRAVAELRRRGVRSCLLVTGAADVHNRDSQTYARELGELCRELKITNCAFFLHKHFAVTDRDLASVYAVSDALLFPSRQEGFGIPSLEAALHRLPIFCADIEPLRALALPGAVFFAPEISPKKFAEILHARLAADETLLARKRALRDFSWDALAERILKTLSS